MIARLSRRDWLKGSVAAGVAALGLRALPSGRVLAAGGSSKETAPLKSAGCDVSCQIALLNQAAEKEYRAAYLYDQALSGSLIKGGMLEAVRHYRYQHSSDHIDELRQKVDALGGKLVQGEAKYDARDITSQKKAAGIVKVLLTLEEDLAGMYESAGKSVDDSETKALLDEMHFDQVQYIAFYRYAMTRDSNKRGR